MKSRLFPILLLMVLVMPGCSLPPSSRETPQLGSDFDRMQQSQQEISRRMVQVEDTLARLESRLQEQQRATDELRRSTATQKVTSIGQKTETSTVDALPDPAISPSELYLQAFSDYASGRYSEAIQGFEAFIGNYPGSDYAGNAQYWLGECYYALENYDQAVRELQKVGDKYPGKR
jgi:TolA-binding protein